MLFFLASFGCGEWKKNSDPWLQKASVRYGYYEGPAFVVAVGWSERSKRRVYAGSKRRKKRKKKEALKEKWLFLTPRGWLAIVIVCAFFDSSDSHNHTVIRKQRKEKFTSKSNNRRHRRKRCEIYVVHFEPESWHDAQNEKRATKVEMNP